MTSDNSQVSSEYIRLFFNDIEQLNDFTATYKNVLVEVKSRIDADDIQKSASKVDTEEKKRLWFQAQYVRYLITRIDLKLNALSKKVPELKDLDFAMINQLRDNIREATLPDFKEVEKYAGEINGIFVTSFASKYLEGAAEGYSSFISGTNNDQGDGTQQ